MIYSIVRFILEIDNYIRSYKDGLSRERGVKWILDI
jgi:hypothetical protein